MNTYPTVENNSFDRNRNLIENLRLRLLMSLYNLVYTAHLNRKAGRKLPRRNGLLCMCTQSGDILLSMPTIVMNDKNVSFHRLERQKVEEATPNFIQHDSC